MAKFTKKYVGSHVNMYGKYGDLYESNIHLFSKDKLTSLRIILKSYEAETVLFIYYG